MTRKPNIICKMCGKDKFYIRPSGSYVLITTCVHCEHEVTDYQ